jgi:UPF0755 protein
MNNRRGGIRSAFLILIAAMCAACWVFVKLSPASPRTFIVNRGVSAHQLAGELKKERFIWSRWSFLLWAKLRGSSGIHPGVYTLTATDTGRDIFHKFLKGPPALRITFPEGWAAKQMAAVLEAKGITSSAEFLQIVNKEHREGTLFPDTYFFQQRLPAQEVIGRLVRQFHEKEPKDMAQQSQILHLSEAQIVTLASLVEKEARVPQERPLIAGVYYNRLKKHMRLEADPTVQYALGEWKPKLTYKDLDVNSPYNTYRHLGLPPGPICNPGAASLQAAAHPEKTDMLFFVAEGGGTHRFSKQYEEHLAIQKEMHKHK